VNFVLSRRGGRIFERETGRHVNDYMAIILDGRVQGQPPVIKSQIGQRGQIELGAKPLQDARTSPWCSKRERSPRRSRSSKSAPSGHRSARTRSRTASVPGSWASRSSC